MFLWQHRSPWKTDRQSNRPSNRQTYGFISLGINIDTRNLLYYVDANVHQKLHDQHIKKYGPYYNYWYGDDLFNYDSQVTQIIYRLMMIMVNKKVICHNNDKIVIMLIIMLIIMRIKNHCIGLTLDSSCVDKCPDRGCSGRRLA